MNKFSIHGTLNDGILVSRLLLFINFYNFQKYYTYLFSWFYISPGSGVSKKMLLWVDFCYPSFRHKMEFKWSVHSQLSTK